MAYDKKSIEDVLKKGAGIEINSAMEALIKKGISTENIEELTIKLFRSIVEDINKKDIDDNYKVLFHLVLAFYIFDGAIKSFDEWIKTGAEEHQMIPDKYIKIIYSLKK